MAKINIKFDNKDYSIDESALSAAMAKLKTHLTTVMNGSGATIKLDGTTYNISSSKLTAATNEFISHLGSISGNGASVTVNGISYSVDSNKLGGAIAELNTVLGGLNSGGDSGLNEYGFYFDKPYVLEDEMDGDVIKAFMTFHEDGSVKNEVYLNGVVEEELTTEFPAGTCTYNQDGIYCFGELVYSILDNGNKILLIAEGLEYILEDSNSEPGLNEYGFYYDTKYSCDNHDGDQTFPNGEISFYFKENQTVDMHVNNSLVQTLPVTYGTKSITIPALNATVDVLSDGKELHVPSYRMFKLGDSYILDGDYGYMFTGLDYIKEEIGEYCWHVLPRNTINYYYGEIRSDRIDGYPLMLSKTFVECHNLTTAPVIPSSVVDMEMTFMNCQNLTGNVEINCDPITYDYCFDGTTKPITITGSCSTETKAALAATANNGNVTYEGMIPANLTFADASWDQIATISESGRASEYFKVGDIKTIELTDTDGTVYTGTVAIADFDHDDLADGTGKAGITIDCQVTPNIKDVPTSYNLTSFGITPMLPTDLTNVIKTVSKKRYTVAATSPSSTSYTLFPYVPVELNLWGSTELGTAYPLFEKQENRTVKNKVTNENVSYFTRTRSTSYAYPYYSVKADGTGDSTTSVSSTTKMHVKFGFCV